MSAPVVHEECTLLSDSQIWNHPDIYYNEFKVQESSQVSPIPFQIHIHLASSFSFQTPEEGGVSRKGGVSGGGESSSSMKLEWPSQALPIRIHARVPARQPQNGGPLPPGLPVRAPRRAHPHLQVHWSSGHGSRGCDFTVILHVGVAMMKRGCGLILLRDGYGIWAVVKCMV